MTESVAINCGINRECLVRRKQLVPFEFLSSLVELVGVVGLERNKRFQYSERRTATEIRLVHHSLIASERHHPTPRGNIFRSKIHQLFGKHVLKSLKRLCHQIHLLSHALSSCFNRNILFALAWTNFSFSATSSVTQMLPPITALLPMVMRPSTDVLE